VIVLPLKYKIDVVDALKAKGFYPQKIRKEKLLSESTMTKLRRGESVSWENLETICKLLGCQPGDIIEYIDD
jgi:putative transcriptional regulator